MMATCFENSGQQIRLANKIEDMYNNLHGVRQASSLLTCNEKELGLQTELEFVLTLKICENDRKSVHILNLDSDNTISITNIKVPEQPNGDSRDRIRRFSFDRCFGPQASQHEVYKTVSSEVQNALQHRFNCCVLAYGQSSSGKTYTISGLDEESSRSSVPLISDFEGVAPRLCRSMFHYLHRRHTEPWNNVHVSVSYLEIYNEKVRDLLTNAPAQVGTALRVREHPKRGPYVQGLSEKIVTDAESLLRWFRLGTAARKTAATGTNRRSSRSHSVFTITCTATVLSDSDSSISSRSGAGEESAVGHPHRVHLVDLAGSERPGTRAHTHPIFREGAHINRSLVALGNVISALAVSPSSTCYNETVNTLRFGQRAKQIVVQPVTNEDPKETLIRNLRAEIERLKQLLLCSSNTLGVQLQFPVLHEFTTSGSDEYTSSIADPHSMSSEFSECVSSSTPAINTSTESVNSQTTFISPTIHEDMSTTKPDRAKLRRTHSVLDADKEPEPSSSRKTSLDKLRRVVTTKTTAVEKGVSTENRTPISLRPPIEIKSRVDSRRNSSSAKPRSQIVAAVTQRLYNKVKKKEIGTGTDDLIPESNRDLPKELSICSNARLRLRELTHKALKAHKWRHIETQTDHLFPVLRVKEISTDVDDLELELLQVKHAEINTDDTETCEVAIDCCTLDDFNHASTRMLNAFLVTRTCGTQSDIGITKQPSPQPQRMPMMSNTISFKKYLEEPPINIINPTTPSLIYANSVNLNVSHNFPRSYSDASSSTTITHKTSDTQSQDSLEDDTLCLNPTPDLISNHNSLEPHPVQMQIHRKVNVIKFALTNFMQQELFMNDERDFTLRSATTLARSSWAPGHNELDSFNRISCFTAEIVTDSKYELCHRLLYEPLYLEQQFPVLVSEDPAKSGIVTLTKPLVLKSTVRCNSSAESVSDCSSTSQYSSVFSTNLPDSLDYHHVNLKRVRFRGSMDLDTKMIDVMSNFLKEASSLMGTLSAAASKIEPTKTGNSEIVFKDANVLAKLIRSTSKRTRKHHRDEPCSSQQNHRRCQCPCVHNANTTTQTSDHEAYTIPANNLERLVRESCDRLESCIDRNQHQHCRGGKNSLTDYQRLHRFPQPFCVADELPQPTSPWMAGNSSTAGPAEDTSLESNYTFSDYGSLPRRGRGRPAPLASPSAYLKQLTSMRKRLVEDTRVCTEAGASASNIPI